jgi:hypothetical protein
MTFDDRLTLSEDQLDRLADLLAVRLASLRTTARPMLTVEDICRTFQVSRAWVYENAGRLGGVKLGPGHRAPLRFDPDQVVAALSPLTPSDEPQPPEPPVRPRRKRSTHLHPVYDG